MLVVFGAGGHGKVVADILVSAGVAVDGFLDDGRAVGTPVLGVPVLGGLAWLAANPGASVALGIGDNAARARIAEACVAHGATLLAAIHPRATVAASSKVEEGPTVMAHAVVNPDSIIHRGAIVNTAAVVEHDCVIGAFAHVSPRAVMGGGCSVGERAQLGIGATMLPGTSVGARSIVGGGALVARPIPDDVIAYGVPARVARPIS